MFLAIVLTVTPTAMGEVSKTGTIIGTMVVIMAVMAETMVVSMTGGTKSP
ncbi:hypothetical protein NTGBS_110003 [Candidatus Nitrotoga sp. BS]|nr:hypothetical protein NTGBS_110003 [Candidatus Nitrotoga sp. BS]